MAANIDVPFLPSADQIRRREFASVRRGYDPDQVRDYLVQIADQIEKLEQDLREARLRQGGPDATPAPPATSEDPYERLSKRFSTLLATADQEVEGIVEQARAESARMMNEARTEADRIRSDSKARAEEARKASSELLEKAKTEADRVLLGLSARRQDLVQHLQDMQERLLGVARELEVAIESPRSGSKRSKPASDPAQPEKAPDAPSTKAEQTSEDTVGSLEGMLQDDGIDLPELPPLELDFDEDDE